MPIEKTRKMLGIEERLGEPLEDAIARLIPEKGLGGTAEELGISRASLDFWMAKLRLTIHPVVLKDGESVEIKRNA